MMTNRGGFVVPRDPILRQNNFPSGDAFGLREAQNHFGVKSWAAEELGNLQVKPLKAGRQVASCCVGHEENMIVDWFMWAYVSLITYTS